MKKTKLNIGSYHDSSLGEIAYDLFWEKYPDVDEDDLSNICCTHLKKFAVNSLLFSLPTHVSGWEGFL